MSSALVSGGFGQLLVEPTSIEQVVAKDECTSLAVDEVLSDDECLGDAVGLCLSGIAQRDAPLTAVTQETFDGRSVDGCGDDQDAVIPASISTESG